MNDVSNVALLTHTTHKSIRISGIIDELKCSSHITQDPLKLLSIIDGLGNDTNLVIIDFDIGIEEGFQH